MASTPGTHAPKAAPKAAPMAIRIVVADNDAVVLAAVCDALSADDRFAVVATAVDAAGAVAAVAEHRPDAVLLDLRMPGGGVAAAREIHDRGLPVTITVATAKVEAATVGDLLGAGVHGIFAKGRLGALLGDMISRCVAGQVLLLVPTGAEGLRLYGRPAR